MPGIIEDQKFNRGRPDVNSSLPTWIYGHSVGTPRPRYGVYALPIPDTMNTPRLRQQDEDRPLIGQIDVGLNYS